MRRYWYSILLTGSMIVMAATKLSMDIPKNEPIDRETAAILADNRMVEAQSTEMTGAMTVEAEETEKMEAMNAEESTPSSPETEERAVSESDINEDFSSVLFIGDSRTVGLSEYGDLGQADVFANSGMSVFDLFEARVSVKGGEKKTLEEVFASENYRTIYLMLGINELGYEDKAIVNQYRSVVERIREEQPAAALVLEANLHVTGEKAAKSNIFNNQRIDALNKLGMGGVDSQRRMNCVIFCSSLAMLLVFKK